MAEGNAQLWYMHLPDYPGFDVYHYEAGNAGSNKTVWKDPFRNSAATQPVKADSNGWVQFYGDGDYFLQIKDSSGVLLQSLDFVRITADTATLWEGTNGQSLPAVTPLNTWQLFLLQNGSEALDLLVNDGSGFKSLTPLGAGVTYLNPAGSKYGAKFDRSTDDTDAILQCIEDAEASAVEGDRAVILAPSGGAVISDQIVIPAGVRFEGMGSQLTSLVPAAGFSYTDKNGDAAVRLGGFNGSAALAPGALLRNIQVDMTNHTASTKAVGVYTNSVGSGGGVDDVFVQGFTRHGFHFDFPSTASLGPSNFILRDIHAEWSQAEYTAVTGEICSAGLAVVGDDGCSGGQNIRITNEVTTQGTTTGAIFVGTGGEYSGITVDDVAVGVRVGDIDQDHCVGLTIGEVFGGTGSILVNNATGTHTSAVSTVEKSNEGIVLRNIRRGGYTTVLRDEDNENTSYTDDVVTLYVLGSGNPAAASHASTNSERLAIHHSIQNRLKKLSVEHLVNVPDDVAATNSFDASFRSNIRLTNTSLATITAGTEDGQVCVVRFMDGNSSVDFSGGNIRNGSAGTSDDIGTWSPATGDRMFCEWDNDNSVWRGYFNHQILTGTTSPSVTPGFVGQMFIDTSTPNVYISTGVASSSDWKDVLN